MTSLSVALYSHIPIGIRSVRSTLEILNEWVPGLIEKIPSHVTIAEWCHKAGLKTLLDAPDRIRWEYAGIIDESITIGKQKALIQLAVPATSPGHPLRLEDTEVVGISVAPSWTGENVQAEIEATTKKITNGTMKYITSDGGKNLVKGIRLAGVPGHLDISHTTGNIIKSVYDADEEFKAFTTWIETLRLQVQLTENAYLQPPKQRSIARFMNIFSWVDWAARVISVYQTLPEKVKEVYAPLPQYKSLVDELKLLMSMVTRVETLCKEKGLSIDISNLLQKEIADIINKPETPNRVRLVACGLVKYLMAETRLLPDRNAKHQISSDIIESSLGHFKLKSSHNKNCGVTLQILMMPLATKLKTRKGREQFDYARAMIAIRRADMQDWRNMKLDENMMSRRRNALKNASGF